MNPLSTGCSIPEPTCPTCRNLSRFRFVDYSLPGQRPQPLQTSIIALRASAKKGCPICSLVVEALRTFIDSLKEDNPATEVRIETGSCSEVDLHFSEAGTLVVTSNTGPAGPEVDLELLTTEGLKDFPALQRGVQLPAILDLESTVSIANEWLRECFSHGAKCQAPRNPLLPTRVLDLGPLDISEDIKLLISDSLMAPYVALSYCWGDVSKMTKTTRSNLSSLTASIPWEVLPLTFQDAITLTKALGVRYIHIDALCIIQDEVSDWETESAKMAETYSNSYLTIAATSGSDCFQGLFTPRWTRTPTGSYETSHQGKKISIGGVQLSGLENQRGVFARPLLHLAHSRFIEIENADRHITDAPLLSRAWAFQERLLPSRTLHFHGEELLWECKSGISCECRWFRSGFNGGETIGKEHGEDSAEQQGGWLKQWFASAAQESNSLEFLGYAWLDLVSEFSRLHLTHESDRMPAISGLAGAFSGKALGSYVAGIWEGDLARGLLFQRVNTSRSARYGEKLEPSEPEKVMPQQASPSWSWTSVHLNETTAISYNSVLRDGFEQHNEFEIGKLSCSVAGGNPFSWATNAVLKIKAPLAEAELVEASTVEENDLKMRLGNRLIFSGDYWSDRHIPLFCGSKIQYILVGRGSEALRDGSHFQWVLILQRAETRKNAFHRIGIVQVKSSENWFSAAVIQWIELI